MLATNLRFIKYCFDQMKMLVVWLWPLIHQPATFEVTNKCQHLLSLRSTFIGNLTFLYQSFGDFPIL